MRPDWLSLSCSPGALQDHARCTSGPEIIYPDGPGLAPTCHCECHSRRPARRIPIIERRHIDQLIRQSNRATKEIDRRIADMNGRMPPGILE